jgi:aryl-alcohol dehydrogenase
LLIQHIPLLIQLWRDGKFPFDRLVSYYDWKCIDQALEDLKCGRTLKPVLLFD